MQSIGEVWYVLESGIAVPPHEVAPDDTGVLRHESGEAVAMRGAVPSTRGIYGADDAAAPVKQTTSAAAVSEPADEAPAREITAEPQPAKKRGRYVTRKAD